MIINKIPALIAALFCALGSSSAFTPSSVYVPIIENAISNSIVTAMSAPTEDCGCAVDVKFSGKPPEVARSLNHREVVRNQSIYNVHGKLVMLDDLIGKPTSNEVSVVVFLRSLG